MGLMDKMFEGFYYIRIVVGIFLLGLLIGAILFIFVFEGDIYGWIFGGISALAGLVGGFYLADYAGNRMGTVNFMGATMHNKEFDDTDMMKTKKK